MLFPHPCIRLCREIGPTVGSGSAHSASVIGSAALAHGHVYLGSDDGVGILLKLDL